MFYAGDEYYDDEVTSGLSTIDPWYLLAPIDETTGQEAEPDTEPYGAGDAPDIGGDEA